MTLRHTLLLAAFGASVLTAPAFGQGAYGTNYSLPDNGADEEETGTLPPGSVGGYGEPPPGYSDPYSRPAPVRRDQVERTDLAPPSGQPQSTYPQAPAPQATYGAPAQSGYPQPVQPGYGRSPQAVAPQPGNPPAPVQPYGNQAYGNQGYGQPPAQPGYGQSAQQQPPVYSQPPQQPGYGQPPQAAYGDAPAYGAPPRAAVDQDAIYASINAGPPPAGVYAPNTGVVPGTTEAPSGPRIENIDPTEPVPERFRRQTVDYVTTQPAGTIVIDTPNTYLYYVLGGGKAVRYGIGVGREGFTWAGTEKVTAKKEWADWRPPSEMIQRQPYLPRFMAGGPGNPLGARTMYLGGTVYRIHGTNEPQTIGKFVSSGCFRMLNADVEDLYDRVKVGTKVVIMPKASNSPQANAAGSAPAVSTASAGR
ncbi:L,D-transpeptidase family protein [Xanthobacter dioxanivorans]|uniref:L,D-transpeptidase family protein n=1 Tax=Xanthobacter dioxanivorans TaxID=2528964 RepID=A0A974PTC8_9HYPH|nr:L,D-transpeptidase [Xanthobacter dioxanivorans]QRG08750.1 L,D-transpeptidase family protein [Xanthobacter dioxanivorans]